MHRQLIILFLGILSLQCHAQAQEKYYLTIKKVFAPGYDFYSEDRHPILQRASKKDFESVHGYHLEVGYKSKEKIFFGFVVRQLTARNLPEFGWGEMHEIDIKHYFTGLTAAYPIKLGDSKLAISPSLELGLINPYLITRTGSSGILDSAKGGQLIQYSVGTDVYYSFFKHCQFTAGLAYTDNLTTLITPEAVFARSRIFQFTTGIRFSI